jgi:hypothetical protein
MNHGIALTRDTLSKSPESAGCFLRVKIAIGDDGKERAGQGGDFF